MWGYPEIFNSDRGSQYTSEEFQKILQEPGCVKISMDGRGRCMDNYKTLAEIFFAPKRGGCL
jgi:putative transposase